MASPEPSEGGVPLPRLSPHNLPEFSFTPSFGLDHDVGSIDFDPIADLSAASINTRNNGTAVPHTNHNPASNVDTTFQSRCSSPATGVSNQIKQHGRTHHAHNSMTASSVGTGITSLGGRPHTGVRSHGSVFSAASKFHNPLSSAQLRILRGGHETSPISPTTPADARLAFRSGFPGQPRHASGAYVPEDMNIPASPTTDIVEQESVHDYTTSAVSGHHDGSAIQARTADNTNFATTTNHTFSPQSDRRTSRGSRHSFPLGLGDQRKMEKIPSGTTSPSPTSGRNHPDQAHDDMAGSSWQPRRMGRNHQYHLGRMIFCFGGRFMNTRARPINIITGTLIIAPCIIFLAVVAPDLWRQVSPALPILFGYIFLMCISSFFHASLSDPGTMPRNLHPPQSQMTQRVTVKSFPVKPYSLISSCTGRTQDGDLTGAMSVPVKFCRTCLIVRPPRVHHCQFCDSCIETQDHHCVWLNNCVGRRNYRYFIVFIGSGSILAFFLSACCLAQMLVRRNRIGLSLSATVRARSTERAAMALFVYGLVAGLYPLALWLYHLRLTARGETTREFLATSGKSEYPRYLPFSQGSILRNWIAIYFRPRPPSYLQFKAPYLEGDQRFGAEKVPGPFSRVFRLRSAEVNQEHVTARTFVGETFAGPPYRNQECVEMGNMPRN